jgi:HK97 family phage major capsid protein
MHPARWQSMRSERSSDDSHYIAGSWATPAPPTMWNVPVILTPGIDQDRAIVIDAGQLAILDRQAVTFEFGRVNDQFNRNLVTARAELRAGLMVGSPSAVQLLVFS